MPEDSMSKTSRLGIPPIQNRALFVVALILVGWVLQATAPVSIPLVFALFLSVMLAPFDRRIVAAVPPALAWLGRIASLILLFAVLSVLIGALAFAAARVAEQLPQVASELERRIEEGLGASVLPDAFPGTLGDAGSAFGGWAVDRLTSLARMTAAAIGTATASLILVIFLVLLLLSERAAWRDKAASMFGSDDQETWENIAEETAMRLRRFLVVRTIIGVLTAALYMGWLWIFGLDLILVWGLLTFVLTFIPNIGSVISGLLPSLFAFAVLPFGTAFLLGAGLFAIEQIIGNWVDPRIQGRQIVLSPAVILISLLFWSWLWGVPGAFLSTPIMVALMVVLARIRSMRPVALALSNQRDYEALDREICA